MGSAWQRRELGVQILKTQLNYYCSKKIKMSRICLLVVVFLKELKEIVLSTEKLFQVVD